MPASETRSDHASGAIATMFTPSADVATRVRWIRWVTIVALATIIVALDFSTPAGVAWGLPYVLVVVLGLGVHRRYEIQVIAAACSALTLAGLFAERESLVPPVILYSNRALTLLAIWSVAVVVLLARRAEREREAARRVHEAVVATAVDAIITIDDRGTIVACNAATLRLFRYEAAEVLGQNVAMLMPSPHREAHDEYIRHYLDTGERRIIGIGREVTARRKDGTIFPIDLGVSEFRVDGRRFFTGIVHDLSQRKQAESAVARANRSLAEKNRELQNIVFVASHDLRSPLVNIQGFSRELAHSCAELRKRLPAGAAADPANVTAAARILDEEIPEALHFIEASATKMDALLNGLLRLSRLGRAALRMEALDMDALVSGITRAMEYQLQAAGARLQVEPLPGCWGDATQIGQVLSNLLDNALKYRAEDRVPEIRVTGRVDGEMAEYRVADNGIGIDPAHREHVFEIFHRLDPRRPGEGLGLTIAQRIVERHRGSIGVESNGGQGTMFVVRLPQEAGPDADQEDTA